MTDAELIARLGEDVFYGDERLHNLSRHNPLHMEARDRIKALTKERDALIEWSGQASVRAERAEDLAERLEAKLAENEVRLRKAVEALKDMCLEFRQADLPYGSAAYAKARATLAEISSEAALNKGESHDH